MSRLENERKHARFCNDSEKVVGSMCNKCDWFEVLTSRKWFNDEFGVGFRDVERYYCNKGGVSIPDPGSMTEEMCRKFRELRRKWL